MVTLHRQHAAIDEMKGMGWEGDLNEMRQLRDFDANE